MTSKVLMKLPTVSFSQGEKSSQDMIILSGRNFQASTVAVDKTGQLEQSIKFLQDQHQTTLVALHEEIETLRQRNKDLQFELVFKKDTPATSSNICSLEDTENGCVESKQGSLASANDTPMQVEILEKDLQDLKISLLESKQQIECLTDIIKQQKIKLHTIKKKKMKKLKPETVDVEIQVRELLTPDVDSFTERMKDAKTFTRLNREVTEQPREMGCLKISSYRGGARSRNHQGPPPPPIHPRRDQMIHNFPPLQTQSFWHRSFDHNEYHRTDRSRNDRQQLDQPQNSQGNDGTVLPQLCHSGRQQPSESYYFRDSGAHKFRGQTFQRGDRYHRRDHKDRNFIEDHRRMNPGEESRDPTYLRKQAR